MTDFNSIIQGITQVTQTVGAINGAVNTIAPALQSMNQAVGSVANVVNPGYRQDMYAPPPGYYPQQQQMPATMPMPQSTPPDESSIMGTVGNAVSGAGIGALQGTKLAASLKTPKPIENPTPSTEGIASNISAKIPQSAKSVMGTGLKAGGISAAFAGVLSGIENIMRLNKNEITGAEATGSVVADTTVGFFTGVGGLAAGTGAAMALGGLSSVGGMVGAGVAGLVGAVGIDMLFRKTGIRQAIADGVRSLFS